MAGAVSLCGAAIEGVSPATHTRLRPVFLYWCRATSALAPAWGCARKNRLKHARFRRFLQRTQRPWWGVHTVSVHDQLHRFVGRHHAGQGKCEHAVFQLGRAGGGVNFIGQLPGALHLAGCAGHALQLDHIAFDADLQLLACQAGTSSCSVVALSFWVTVQPAVLVLARAGVSRAPIRKRCSARSAERGALA